MDTANGWVVIVVIVVVVAVVAVGVAIGVRGRNGFNNLKHVENDISNMLILLEVICKRHKSKTTKK